MVQFHVGPPNFRKGKIILDILLKLKYNSYSDLGNLRKRIKEKKNNS